MGTEWIMVIKGITELAQLAVNFAESNNGEPPTEDQIAQLKAKRATLEDEWASLAPDNS